MHIKPQDVQRWFTTEDRVSQVHFLTDVPSLEALPFGDPAFCNLVGYSLITLLMNSPWDQGPTLKCAVMISSGTPGDLHFEKYPAF